MSALFEYDMCLLMSPRREEDWDQDIAFNKSDSSVYAVTKMGSIEEFTMRCKEYVDQSQPMEQNDDDMEGVVEENENDGIDDVMEEYSEYKRLSHVIRHSIASYFKDEMIAVKPDIRDYRTLKVLQKLVNESVNVPNNQKKVRIVKIPGITCSPFSQ
ncbi:hypothetical protein BDC45DRAFT_542748 [Circinella umbellata]|nr:hypothetical protein BDC45DRAFT_542748 [Circinella umbellata]